MTRETVERFVDGLRALERGSDAGPIVDAFADDCELANSALPGPFEGREGAREFWEAYRAHFDEVESHFRNVIVDDERAALEWVTRGTFVGGDRFQYAGVTILETADGKVMRFHAHFDPTSLGRQRRRERAAETAGR